MTNYKLFIKLIKEQLEKELPGENFQLQMAPSSRLNIKKTANDNNVKKSSVLILNYPSQKSIQIVFIKRAEDGGVHSGQIAFPGGKFEDTDLTLINTALRETYEEIGIESANIKILGKLTELYIPISNFSVLPVIGFINTKPNFKINTKEVSKIITLDIQSLLDKNIKSNKIININKLSITAPYFEAGDYHIWGATAMILNEYLEIITRTNYYKNYKN